MLDIRIVKLHLTQAHIGGRIEIDQLAQRGIVLTDQIALHPFIRGSHLGDPFHRFNLVEHIQLLHLKEIAVLLNGITLISIIDRSVRIEGHQQAGSQNNEDICSNQPALQ